MKRINRTRKVFLVATLLLLFLACFGFIYEKVSRSRALVMHPPPGTMISVGPHKLHLDCRGKVGENMPVILLEAGLDPLGSLTWSTIHDSLASITRTCAYDRAGIAWSDPGPEKRNGNRITDELNKLLSNAGEKGPYLFVSHSMGGPYSLLFSEKYPESVAGLVLVESTHPDQFNRMPPEMVRKPPPKFILNAVPKLRKLGVWRHVMQSQLSYQDLIGDENQEILASVSASSMSTVLSEFSNINETLKAASLVTSLGNKPLTVIAIGSPPDASKIRDIDQENANEIFGLWEQMQYELSQLSSEGKFIQVPNTTHYLHFDEPKVVIQSVIEMLSDYVRTSKADE